MFGQGVSGSINDILSLQDLCVGVVARGGLEWVLAWRQLGARRIWLQCSSEIAREAWARLESGFSEDLGMIGVVESMEGLELDVVSSVVTNEVDARCWHEALEFCSDTLAVCVSRGGSRSELWVTSSSSNQRSWNQQLCRHKLLGGLTSARCHVLWSGLGSSTSSTSTTIDFTDQAGERSTAKFLEPSAKLDVWEPSDTARKNAPWPVPEDLWIKAETVYLHKKVVRPLSDKEWAQLHDLRPEWGYELRPILVASSSCGVVPLRFLIELATKTRQVLKTKSVQRSLPSSSERVGRQLLSLLPGNLAGDGGELGKYFGWTWEKDACANLAVATRDDNAVSSYALWAVGGPGEQMEASRTVIRRLLWGQWYRRVFSEAVTWLNRRQESHPDEARTDQEASIDCLTRLSNSDWFEWVDGSRLLYWRWPERWLLEARDGSAAYVLGRPQERLEWQRIRNEAWIAQLSAEKMLKLIRRRYLEKGPVRVTIPFFEVPKGDTDIRVVWDLTKNGVNEFTYSPSFFLMGMVSLVLRLSAGMEVGDFDIGEMFHNMMLHEDERPMCGVHIDSDMQERLKALGLEDPPEFLRWARLLFGWRSAPYKSVTMLMRGIEIAKGNPRDQANVFHFDKVVLNLPTRPDYDPGLPRVYKLRSDGLRAVDSTVFVDDGRVFGPNRMLTSKGIRRLTSVLQHLGFQDAPRKRNDVSQRPRVWTGGVVYLDKGMVRKFVSVGKWQKLKGVIEWICSGEPEFERKQFESALGFLVHISSTYDFIRPYLIGFYLAMHAFRDGRDINGWKVGGGVVPDEPIEELLDAVDAQLKEDDAISLGRAEETTLPPTVPATSLLRRNAETLRHLTQGEDPIQALVFPVANRSAVAYAGSDASGEGYGTRDEQGGKPGEFVYGYWTAMTDDSTSNWREMRTVLDKIRDDVAKGRLTGTEMWFFTDNSVLERAYYKGYSASPALYAMVEELRARTLQGNFILRIVHVAGTRMIETGIDGLSRGDLELGLLAKSLRDSVPLGASACERSPQLMDWVRSWAGTDVSIATPFDWHFGAHQSTSLHSNSATETWVWDLAPAAALYALEELAVARTKRHDLLRGVVLAPALLMPEWYRRFSKTADVYFRIPAGAIPEWPAEMHEPLHIGIYLPLFSCFPWDWKQVTWMGNLGRAVSAMFKNGDPRAGDHVREFWRGAAGVPTLQPGMVRRVLQAPNWFPLFSVGTKG